MLVQGVRDYAIYMLDTEGQVTNWNSGAEASRVIRPTKSSASISPAFTRPRTAPAASPSSRSRLRFGKENMSARPGACARTAALFLGQRRSRPDLRRGRHGTSASPRSRETSPNGKRRRRSWKKRAPSLFQSQKLQALGELTGGHRARLQQSHDGGGGVGGLPAAQARPAGRQAQAISRSDRRNGRPRHDADQSFLAFGRRQPIKPEVFDLNLRLDA